MFLSDFMVLFVSLLSLFTILILVFIIDNIVITLKARKIRKKHFDKVYFVGSLFYSNVKNAKFPCGKWECLGKDQNGHYLYERIK